MKHYVLLALLASGLFVTNVSAAMTDVGATYSVRCGEVDFVSKRIIDGVEVKATKGTIMHSHFIYDKSERTSVYPREIHVLSCLDSKLAISKYSEGRYTATNEIYLMNHTGDALRQEFFATVTDPKQSSGLSMVTPTTNEQVARQLLIDKRRFMVDRAVMVAKTKSSVPSLMLTDRSFYVYGTEGALLTRTAPSYWGTVNEVMNSKCGDFTYRLYEKRFADKTTTTSTYPMSQYIVTRTNASGITTTLPVPMMDGSWKKNSTLAESAGLAKCSAHSVYLSVGNRMTVITPNTSRISLFDTMKSIGSSLDSTAFYFDGRGYYTEGRVSVDMDGKITSDSAIRTLNADGTVTVTKPAYYKDITQQPGSVLRFLKHPEHRELTSVIAVYPGVPLAEFATYRNGAYVNEVMPDLSKWVYTTTGYFKSSKGTPMYVQTEGNQILLKSVHIPKPTLLHLLPAGSTPSQNWFIVGELKENGTREITYTFTLNGVKQIWKATVK